MVAMTLLTAATCEDVAAVFTNYNTLNLIRQSRGFKRAEVRLANRFEEAKLYLRTYIQSERHKYDKWQAKQMKV